MGKDEYNLILKLYFTTATLMTTPLKLSNIKEKSLYSSILTLFFKISWKFYHEFNNTCLL